jgi:hypothetical protein
MRKFKAEALAQWDGLTTSNAERVTVLGATNRPWDLDEAVLRRFSRRLYVRATISLYAEDTNRAPWIVETSCAWLKDNLTLLRCRPWLCCICR